MEILSAKVILCSKTPENASERELSRFLERKRRIFLQVLHEIFSRRNDKSGIVYEWVDCLFCVAESNQQDGLEDFPNFMLRLAAFQQYREKKESLPNYNAEKKNLKKGVSDSNNSKSLLQFLCMPNIVKIMNDTIEANTFSPSETDWMALNLLFRHELIDRRLYAHVLSLASGTQGLSGLLEITSEVWKTSIGYVLRQKVENIIFILFKILSDEPNKYDIMLTLCGNHLYSISLRLEAGMESTPEVDAGYTKGLDADFFSSSDEEDSQHEDVKNGISTGLVARIPESDDQNDDDDDDDDDDAENADGSLSPTVVPTKMQDMIRRCILAEDCLPAYRSSWCELCLTAVTILYERLIERKRNEETISVPDAEPKQLKSVGKGEAVTFTSSPECTVVANQSFSDTISSLNSRIWQRQLLALGALVDILERSREIKSRRASEPRAKSVSSISRRGSQVPPSSHKRGSVSSKGTTQMMKPVEEISRSGHLRHLCWGLVSSKGRVRERTASMLQAVLDLSSNDQVAVGMHLWAAFVEQGLVPVLELVRLGYPVDQVPIRTSGLAEEERVMLFPEKGIRELADTTLNILADKVCATSALRVRLASALLHSGNPALRLNIFVALLFLARKSDECGLYIWDMSTPSNEDRSNAKKTSSAPITHNSHSKQDLTEGGSGHGRVFLGMLKSILRDSSELKNVLAVIAHTLRSALEIKNSSHSAALAGNEPDTRKKANSQRGAGGPTVVVLDEGASIKMACPEPSVVQRHSPDLAKILQDIADQEAAREMDVFSPVEDTNLPSLSGSYALWQELFSHMTSDKIQDSSIPRMALDQLVEAFHIARKYRMVILLDKYASALGKRLSVDTIVTVWSCALGKEMVDGVLVSPPPLPYATARGTPDNEPSLPLSQSAPTQPPSSPAEESWRYSTERRLGRGTRAHLGLLSACVDWMEKAGSAAFSKKRPLLATELLELTHQTLGVIIAG